jgi:hypothetical protein
MKIEKWELLILFQEWGRADKEEWYMGWIQIWYIARTLPPLEQS